MLNSTEAYNQLFVVGRRINFCVSSTCDISTTCFILFFTQIQFTSEMKEVFKY